MKYYLLVTNMVIAVYGKLSLEDLRLPDEHIPYFLNNNPEMREDCRHNATCPYKSLLSKQNCWGYEENCSVDQRMDSPVCTGEDYRRKNNKASRVLKFWAQGDFGYIKEKREELKMICKPSSQADSFLECTKHTRFCRTRNIYMDFTTANLSEARKPHNNYREDVFTEGQLGGYCDMDRDALAAEGDHKRPLQSWYAELQEFRQLKERPLESGKCDRIFDIPTILMKLDAGVNMYHHFCDFVNLYLSQHLNNSFSMDIQIIMWDTSHMRYGDLFKETWQAFSQHPIIPLRDLDGQKVCFKDAVFSFLPRMAAGHFYNTPLNAGCERSSMYRAFSQHLLHRLNITQEGPLENKIRVTLLSRSTKHRRILNEDEIVKALKNVDEYEVRVVDYKRPMPFLDQLAVTHNSDIFMGMHGAGLTHQLFLPDWGVIFEIFNCGDVHCYKDLARLRGLRYMTWEKMDKLVQEEEDPDPPGAHKKFTNYEFDVQEFLHMVSKAADHVRSHSTFLRNCKEKYEHNSSKSEL